MVWEASRPVSTGTRVCIPTRDGDSAGAERPADRQVDCQRLELAMFSLDGGGRVQASDLVIWRRHE
jgi:hypothetical protein